MKDRKAFDDAVLKLEALPDDADMSEIRSLSAEIMSAHGRHDQLALALGISVQTLYRWRTGKTRPRQSNVKRLKALTGASDSNVRVIEASMLRALSDSEVAVTIDDIGWLLKIEVDLGFPMSGELVTILLREKRESRWR